MILTSIQTILMKNITKYAKNSTIFFDPIRHCPEACQSRMTVQIPRSVKTPKVPSAKALMITLKSEVMQENCVFCSSRHSEEYRHK